MKYHRCIHIHLADWVVHSADSGANKIAYCDGDSFLSAVAYDICNIAVRSKVR